MRWSILIACITITACSDANRSNSAPNATATNNVRTNNADPSNDTTANTTTANNTPANASTNGCAAISCEELGVSCGMVDDGCGTTLDCGGCDDGFACEAGSCALGVALPCQSDEECYPGLTCLLQAEAGWTGGHCQKDCATDEDCPTGSHCAEDACVRSCESDVDCRGPDYGCWDGDDDGAAECLPLGTGTGEVGDPCMSYADCAGGELGACIVEADGDFVGGYCTIIRCTTDADCPLDTNCLDATTPPICLRDCVTEDECRPQYQCAMVTAAGTSCVPANL